MTNLWKYNKVTGYWVLVRSCTKENSKDWLAIWQGDEPNERFKISQNKPRNGV